MACFCFTGDNAIVVAYGNSNCGLISSVVSEDIYLKLEPSLAKSERAEKWS